jgi:hypothetical protein
VVYASLTIDEDRESADFWITNGETDVIVPLTRQQARMVGEALMDYAEGRRDTTDPDLILQCRPGEVDPFEVDMRPELQPFRKEVEAAIAAHDMVALRAIVEAAGLAWLDPELPEKYRNDRSDAD